MTKASYLKLAREVNRQAADNPSAAVDALSKPAVEVVSLNQTVKYQDWHSLSKPKGVAVTILLHAPTWFQRRYTMMIQNTHENIPDDWLIQVYYTGFGQSLMGVEINRGIKRLIDSGRVRLVVIPPEVLKVKKKKFELMTELWIWQNMMAEKVLLFGGTSVICSNSPRNINQFVQFDYIGAPWNAYKGFGGDGGISIRSRSWMVKVIQYELSKYESEEQKLTVYKKWGQEDHFFMSRIVEMQKKNLPGIETIKLATKNDTQSFAAIGGIYNNDVWAVAGTLPDVPFKERDKFLQLCPEIKMFYPSLHDPGCFGASPDTDKCAASICALRPREQRKGGC